MENNDKPQLNIEIKPEVAGGHYSNLAVISHSHTEFVIDFAQMLPGLPKANVLIYRLEDGSTVIVRPSGTEPKIKTYFTTKGNDLAEAQAKKDLLADACKPILS